MTQTQLENFLAACDADHQRFVDRLARLRAVAEEVAAGNPSVSALAEMDRKAALLCNDLRECCGREQALIFPMLLRLAAQSSISRCNAGMIRARLRFLIAEQEAALAGLGEIVATARRHLSPDGPCEACHELLELALGFEAELAEHIRREQDELFAWAIERENQLACQGT